MIQPRVFGGKLIIYPSPVHDNLFISGINSLERYTIFDVYGQVLLEGNIANNEFIKMTIVYCTHICHKVLKLKAIAHFSKHLYINE